MEQLKESILNSKKIVVKIGSNVISAEDGTVDRNVLYNIVEQVNSLIDMGKQVMVVSSGAGVCGVGAINRWNRRGDLNYKQAFCAIGQVELMMAYKEYFADYDVHVAQILLTRDDFNDHHRTLNIRNTLFTLIDEGVVPIINENDSVCVEEIKIGDNDTLAALTAILWNADLMIILSDIDGVFDKDPKNSDDASLIEAVDNAEELISSISIGEKSSFGTGGIRTKIEAAARVNKFGIPMILLNGTKHDIIRDSTRGEGRGTLFLGTIGK